MTDTYYRKFTMMTEMKVMAMTLETKTTKINGKLYKGRRDQERADAKEDNNLTVQALSH